MDDKQLALNMKRTTAPLPPETRMGSRFITARWVLKSKAALQAAVEDPEMLAEDTDLRDRVLHPDMWLQIEMFTSLLRPLWKLMRRADTDEPCYVMWVYHEVGRSVVSGLEVPRWGVLPRGFCSPTHGPTARAPTKRLPHMGEGRGRREQYPTAGSAQ